MAPPTGPCVPRVDNSNLGMVEKVVSSHGPLLVGKLYLIPSLPVVLAPPWTLLIHSVFRLSLGEFCSKGFDIMSDLTVGSVEGEASDEEDHLSPLGRPHLRDVQVTRETRR